MMEVAVVPVCEITDAGLDSARFDELSHGLPCVCRFDWDDRLCFSRFFKKRDDHRLSFSSPDVADRSRPAFLEHASNR
jgi:hypothetical protein